MISPRIATSRGDLGAEMLRRELAAFAEPTTEQAQTRTAKNENLDGGEGTKP